LKAVAIVSLPSIVPLPIQRCGHRQSYHMTPSVKRLASDKFRQTLIHGLDGPFLPDEMICPSTAPARMGSRGVSMISPFDPSAHRSGQTIAPKTASERPVLSARIVQSRMGSESVAGLDEKDPGFPR
jgi:hypothetical protein